MFTEIHATSIDPIKKIPIQEDPILDSINATHLTII